MNPNELIKKCFTNSIEVRFNANITDKDIQDAKDRLIERAKKRSDKTAIFLESFYKDKTANDYLKELMKQKEKVTFHIANFTQNDGTEKLSKFISFQSNGRTFIKPEKSKHAVMLDNDLSHVELISEINDLFENKGLTLSKSEVNKINAKFVETPLNISTVKSLNTKPKQDKSTKIR